MDNLKRLIKSYEKWVAANPENVCDIETTTKWVSYFIAGRISDSNLVSELVYTLSNMLVLYNDRIIDKSRKGSLLSDLTPVNFDASTSAVARSNHKKEKFVYRLKVMLTTLEYCEVFIEISAKRIFGKSGKWIFVALVQCAKAAGRFYILKHSTEKIITTPALPALNRRAIIKKQKSALKNGEIVEEQTARNDKLMQNCFGDSSFTFQLKRSGRVMRKVEGAPPLQYRDFKLPEEQHEIIACKPINYALVQAEYLYIAKPLIHLAAMGVFGQKALETVCDIVDIGFDQHTYVPSTSSTCEQGTEIRAVTSMRQFAVIFDALTIFERVTSTRLDRALGYVADNVPLLKMVAGPLREYVPYWQSTYFYLWST